MVDEAQQLPAEQPKVEQPKQPQGKTVFEMLGVTKEKQDQLWKIIKIFMIYFLMTYFMGTVIDLFLQQEIFKYVLPLLMITFLIWKFWGKDLLVKK